MNLILEYIKKKIISNLRYSKFHYFYLKFKNPKYIEYLNNDAAFYEKLLDKDYLVFDLGANHGEKIEVFQRYVKDIVCYEPNKELCDKIIKRFRNNKSIIVNQNIVSNSKGMIDFTYVEGNDAYSTIFPHYLSNFSELDKNKFIKKKIKSTTLNSEIKKYGIPNYIKIDCEGAEYLILKDLKYPIKLISFEVNLPQIYEDGVKIIKSLSKKFNYEFNVRQQNEHKFYFSKNIDAVQVIDFMSNKKISIEVFSFLK
tara:strand:+ start:297 stop:1061 length:765 start_codon:yes stop_codon:yes gene_type:complete